MKTSGEAGRSSRLADVRRQQVRQWVGGFRKSETAGSSRVRKAELGNQNHLVGIRLLPNRWQLRVVILDYPGIGKVDMPDIDGIGMNGNQLVCVNFGTVLMEVATMLVYPRQMGVRRRPLHCHEDGQQDKISRGADTLLSQEDGALGETGLHCILTG